MWPREEEEKEVRRQWQPLRAWQPLRTQEISALHQRLGMNVEMDMNQAASLAVGIPLAYAQRGTSLAQAALAGAKVFHTLRHYPRGDVTDAAAHTRFYYHAHRLDAPEHGHFHLFAYRPEAPHQAAPFVHLAALSLNHQGLPTQWFATNQWVTGEQWDSAEGMAADLDHFQVSARGRMAPVAQWLTAMVCLFRPALHQLLRARDQALQPHLAHRPAAAMREDRELDVLATASADLPLRLQALNA